MILPDCRKHRALHTGACTDPFYINTEGTGARSSTP
ncbi:hypothetical protein GDO86_013808 [Hymenochirus boettgeri]|uniref:Uncharacterized protein n=1 Tax=Hymenochirus boettgeri TaxID=247094 RepID=A0A8T2JP75_9PIPI|nr:hypothetical protein GDO86_013808 [Hymenochirus boettgeri]